MAFSSPGLTDVQKRISFGSCQERKMFPLHHAPDRLGIQLIAIRGDPSLGPGCYLNQEVSCSVFVLRAFPSKKTRCTATIGPWPDRHRAPTPALQTNCTRSPHMPRKRNSPPLPNVPVLKAPAALVLYISEKLEELVGITSAAHVLLPFP